MKAVQILLVLIFLVGSSVIINGANPAMGASAQTQAQGFQVVSARLGGSNSTSEAGPGDQDVPLTITLQYLYPYPALYAELEILLPNGFATTSSALTAQSANNDTVYYSNSLQKGQVFEVETYVNLASNVSLGDYSFPTTILWNAVLTNSTNSPEVSLEQNTNVGVSVQGDTKLSFSSSQTALTSGQVNNITLTLANTGSGNASDITTTISSNSQDVSVLDSFPQIATLASQQNITANMELFVSSAGAGSSVSLVITTSYLDASSNQETMTQSLGLFVSTASSTSQLIIKSTQNSLTPGQVNNITLTATNEGSQTLSGISSQVTSSSQSVSVLSEPDVIASLAPGSSADLPIGLFVSASSSNTAVTLSITSTFTLVGPNDTGSISQNLGLYVASQAGSSGNSSLSISAIKSQVLTGVSSEVEFNITNTGSSPVYDPTFSLSVSSPLVAVANSSYSMNNGEIPAGGSAIYEAVVSSSPSSTIGVYDGSITVTYTNQFGISNSQTTQVGFVLTGTIEIVIQDETVSQGTGNLTVSGSLLDEGTASAYYASIVGSTNSTTSSDPTGPSTYIGEIDPNTPVPFSTTIPYTLGSNGSEKLSVTLVLSYKDSFGSNQTADFKGFTTSVSNVNLANTTTDGTGSSSSGLALVQTALYAIIVVVVIAAVVGVTVVRRKRRQMRIESGEETEEAKVV